MQLANAAITWSTIPMLCCCCVCRSKDVVKSGGEWISSIQLENAAMGHPKVLEAAVIGIPDEKWGERPLLVVVPHAGVAGRVAICHHLDSYHQHSLLTINSSNRFGVGGAGCAHKDSLLVSASADGYATGTTSS